MEYEGFLSMINVHSKRMPRSRACG